MIALIEAAFGIKVPAWVIEIVLAALLVGSAALYLEHHGAAGELAKLQKSSAALIESARVEVAKEAAQHAADVQANTEKLNAALAANTDLNTQLAQRVRDFNAYRASHPDVSRPAGGSVTTVNGECGHQSCGDLAGQLAAAGNQLARSVGDLSASLEACQRDRDSLTGLPR